MRPALIAIATGASVLALSVGWLWYFVSQLLPAVVSAHEMNCAHDLPAPYCSTIGSPESYHVFWVCLFRVALGFTILSFGVLLWVRYGATGKALA